MLAGLDTPSLQGRNEFLGLGLLEFVVEIFHDDGADRSAHQGRRNGEALLLLVHLDAPVLGLRAKYDAPTGPQGGSLGSATGSTRALLTIGFTPSAPHFRPGECGRRAPSPVLELGDDAPVHDGSGGVRAGAFQVQRSFAGSLSVEGEDGQCDGLRAYG